jgi:hypothetical protein
MGAKRAKHCNLGEKEMVVSPVGPQPDDAEFSVQVKLDWELCAP